MKSILQPEKLQILINVIDNIISILSNDEYSLNALYPIDLTDDGIYIF